jgi:predicted dehydrogenase
MVEHVTGLRITSLCADLNTFHQTRRKPKGSVETFAGATLRPADYHEIPIDTEDFGAVLLRLGDKVRGAMTASQIATGRKNRLSIEIYGTKGSFAWDAEKPDELWIGRRSSMNSLAVKDPTLDANVAHDGARSRPFGRAGRCDRCDQPWRCAGEPDEA